MSDQKKFICKHIGCGKEFTHSSSRSRHQNSVKHGCCDNILKCYPKSVDPSSRVKCRHTNCNQWGSTKHRTRHEKCGIHSKPCPDVFCVACTRSDEFVRGKPWVEDFDLLQLPPFHCFFKFA
ncbi:hypothetical protein ACTFIY_009313 [Dictyostelium cf. discoideum]